MLLAISANTYAPWFVHFVPPVKNNVLENSIFSRIIYSTETYTMNGIYLKKHTLAQLQAIEDDLMTAYSSTKAKAGGLCAHYMANTVLKISGVWESETACGLAFKFIH
jgi:hypothetical protein